MLVVLLLILGAVGLWYGFAASFLHLVVHSWLPGPGGASFWLKWALLRLPASRCRRRGRFQFYSYENYDPYSYGVLPPPQESALDGVQEHPEDSTRCSRSDDLLLWGSNEKGDVMVARIRRRGRSRTAEPWLYLRTAEGQSYVLDSGVGVPDLSAGTVYAAGGLRLEQLVPMRRWRVAYNGLLRCTSQGGLLVHVQLGVICNTTSNLLEHSADFDANFVARQLARQSWAEVGVPNVNRLLDEVDCYMQTVYCTGSLQVEGLEQRELFLWGLRVKRQENLQFPVETLGEMMGHTKSGLLFYLREVRIHGLTESYQLGMVGLPSTEVYCLHDVTPNIMRTGTTFNEDFRLSFGPPTDKFRFRVQVDGELLDAQRLHSERFGEHGEVKLELRPFLMNDHGGCLVYLSSPCPSEHCATPVTPTIVLRPQKASCRDPVVSLEAEACLDPGLTGGKGASLAALTKLSRSKPQVIVPRGFVVTTVSYQDFVAVDAVQSAIRELEGITCFTTSAAIEACKKVVNAVESTSLPEATRRSIQSGLTDFFGSKAEEVLLAVRSSAVGEDSEDMSAAGQMETFLAIRGADEVLKAVQKCWASQFSHIACGYKRRYGQPLNSPMAVVVQEMVPSQVAGVMFTCDTRTGNPRNIIITANYGIGDSVVSGTTDPDTVILERLPDGAFRIDTVQIGTKLQRTALSEKGGTKLESSEGHGAECCLSEEQMMRLAALGAELETAFCGPRDVEWAFADGRFYVLQSRPVTSLHQQTDCEVIHELDSGIRTSDECLFKANIGEVMNGAQSPLGMTFFTNSMLLASKKEKNPLGVSLRNPYHDRFFIQTLGNVFFPASNEAFKMSGSNPLRKGLAFAMRGGSLDDPDVDRLMQERRRLRCQAPGTFQITRMIRDLWKSEEMVREAYEKFYSWKLPVADMVDPRQIFDEITRAFMNLSLTAKVHGACNMYSIMSNSVAVTLLAHQHGDWSDVVISDFGNLVSTCEDVVSAEVPSALQKMAVEISRSPEQAKFKEMNVEDALEWLRNDTSVIGSLFREFLGRHGHRCINEFDVYSKTWSMDPSPVVKNLQAMVGAVGDYKKKDLSVDDALDGLHVKFGPVKRQLMRWLLQKCRKGVGLREHSKNLMVKMTDAFRTALRHLASQMVAEGRLPEADLLFFLTLPEIEQLLATRSPKLVAKAVRRHRLHPELKKRVFPELFKGIPQLLNQHAKEEVTPGKKSLKGTPVSGGVAEGPARVVRSIEDASHIQKGDVLVAYCTDIAWSPYFPLVSGVVTELGGLISHGAVVAREYGIPCVVGVHGVTGAICSGERVRLDGSTGVLHTVDAAE
uniref:Putative integral to membrane n=2 Tax=Ixodes ricinus TaxID=34613 RepID=V5HAW1_IXORI